MSKVIKLKKGLDIKLKGEAEKVVKAGGKCTLYAMKPTDFRALTPKLTVKVGDVVKAGDALFTDKANPGIKFTAPVSGCIEAINRGERRKLLEVVIKADSEITYRDFGKADVNQLSREEIITRLQDSGTWPLIIQRPYGILANPEITPKAVFISTFDTAPLAPDFEWILKEEGKNLQAGIDCMQKLCNGNVNLGVKEGIPQNAVFNQLKNVNITYFEGPHPAGNVGIQINHISPINKGEHVWTVNIQDLAIIGRLFTEGHYDARKTIALTGSEVKEAAYYKTMIGAQICCFTADKLKNEVHQRIISGNVLTGTKVSDKGFLGFYANQITVIPEGDTYEFLGYAGFQQILCIPVVPFFPLSE